MNNENFPNVFGLAVRNTSDRTRVEYVESGINRSKEFDTYDEAEEWAKRKGLNPGDPWGNGKSSEYRLTK
jgi:hypothetical protein